MDGVGALTGWPIVQEIAAVLLVLSVTVLLLVYGVTLGGPKGDSFAAVILSDEQRAQLDTLVLPKPYVSHLSLSNKPPQNPPSEDAIDSKSETESASSNGDTSTVSSPKETEKRMGSRAASTAWDLATLKMKDMLGVTLEKDSTRFTFDLDSYVRDKQSIKLTPLLVFVNKKSGGQNGDLLLEQLRMFLPPWQVWEIGSMGGPERGLTFFRDVPNFRVLVAGGDGSAAWVLETIDSLNMHYQPPVAVLPVGTGNDLARVLGWGGGLSGGGYAGNGLARQLLDTTHGQIMMLDRWKVECQAVGERPLKKRGKKNDKSQPWKKSLVLNNYLGIGVDAQISLNFHENREASPHLFTSRFINKYVWYVSSGGKEILFQRFADFSNHVKLECDGKLVELPSACEGIIILNIKSYGGGVDLWGLDDDDLEESYDHRHAGLGNNNNNNNGDSGERSSHLRSKFGSSSQRAPVSPRPTPSFRSASFSDGLLEVVSVSSSFQLGAAQVGLARPTRICQCRTVKISTTDFSLPLQVDGEPFNLPKSANISVSFLNQGVMLGKGDIRRKQVIQVDEANQIIDDVLYWARASDYIDEHQKRVLRREFVAKLYSRNRLLSAESNTA